MTTKILMPALSPTMTEGNLSKWLVKEGDKVKAGDVIAEIETDKATMEVEAVDEGIITGIIVKEGTQSVSVNSPIAILNGSTDDIKKVTDDKKKDSKLLNENKNNESLQTEQNKEVKSENKKILEKKENRID